MKEKKDYKILSFKDINNNIYIPKKNFYVNSKYWDGNKHRTKQFLLRNCNTYNIHSIKRLSDGEVFTVGDYTNAGNLTGFSIYNNSIVTHHNPSGQDVNDDYFLNGLNHVKKPLFTTNDGVNIYQGDKCYWITTLGNIYPIHSCNKTNSGNMKFKHFSTQELAEKYLNKKPKELLFTTTDGVNMYKGDTLYYVSNDYNIGTLTVGVNSTWEGRARFSTRKLAEEHVLFNKPCLSLNDISKIYKTADKKYLFANDLKEGGYSHSLVELMKEKTK